MRVGLDFAPGPVILAALALAWLMAWRGRAEIHYPGVPRLLVGLFVGMALGASLVAVLPLERLGLLFGAFILLAVPVSVSGLRIGFSPAVVSVAGALSGFMGTTAAVGAPVLALLHLAGRFGGREFMPELVLIPGVVAGYLVAGRLSSYLDRGYSRIAVWMISTVSAAVLIGRSI